MYSIGLLPKVLQGLFSMGMTSGKEAERGFSPSPLRLPSSGRRRKERVSPRDFFLVGKSKEMSSLCVGLNVLRAYEARVGEFELGACTLPSLSQYHFLGGEDLCS